LTVYRTPGGREVAIDTMDCRRAIAEKIRDKKSHYLLAVKENRPTLYQDIGEYFESGRTGMPGTGQMTGGEGNRKKITGG
jgi:hypothetical protein